MVTNDATTYLRLLLIDVGKHCNRLRLLMDFDVDWIVTARLEQRQGTLRTFVKRILRLVFESESFEPLDVPVVVDIVNVRSSFLVVMYCDHGREQRHFELK